MLSVLGYLVIMSGLDSHLMPHMSGLVPQLNQIQQIAKPSNYKIILSKKASQILLLNSEFDPLWVPYICALVVMS